MFFEKVSLVTGGFDPIHSGHIEYFQRAKDFSDYLVVGINTEEWLTNKKGQYFQSWVCLLYTSPSPRDATLSRMPSSA